ncbi:Membrane protein tms1 [Coemansia sp. RSA 2708]|nr:Membrane protein tms1 [Coemansia sp. RSA 2708]
MYVAFLAMTIADYLLFSRQGCGRNQFFVTANMLLCIMVSAVAVHPRVQEANLKSGLAQAGMVTAYASYLVTSALAGSPPNDSGDDATECNPLARAASARATMAVVGAFFTIGAICYSTTNAAVKSNTLILTSGNNSAYEALATDEPNEMQPTNAQLRQNALRDAVASGALPESALDTGDDDDAASQDDEKLGVQYNYTFFHIIFCMASMYAAMLLTNWNSISSTDHVIIIGRSTTAVWVKVVTSWLCILLYSWTLVGPVVLPDREWA